MGLEQNIKDVLDKPADLEELYQSSNKSEFKNAIISLADLNRSNVVLRVWKERLCYDTYSRLKTTQKSDGNQLTLVIVLSLLAGVYAKLPVILPGINDYYFYLANTPFFVFSALIIFFLVTNAVKKHILLFVAAILFVCLIYNNMLAFLFSTTSRYEVPDTLSLSFAHMPFVLWSLLGISFLGDSHNDYTKRLRFLSYFVETLIYSAVILIGGMILTFLTFSLFTTIKVEIHDWYMAWVVVFGTVAAPIVATYITTNRFVLSGKIAPLMANIFSPLFLVTLLSYVFVLLIQGINLFTDRDSLLVFNIMLLIVLGITIFAISERSQESGSSYADYINFALLSTAMLINTVALTAIMFRLSTYGLTPNRVAVLGANTITFIHLIIVSKSYAFFLAGKSNVSAIHTDIAKYLPVYSVWTCIVVFMFPFLFNFQ